MFGIPISTLMKVIGNPEAKEIILEFHQAYIECHKSLEEEMERGYSPGELTVALHVAGGRYINFFGLLEKENENDSEKEN